MGLIETKEKGFTLVELLVVIAIIAMLSSVVMAGFSDTKQKGRDAAKIRALQEVRSALQLYATDKGGFPFGTNNPGRLDYNLATELSQNNKYISLVNSEVKYVGLNSDKSYCGSGICARYYMGIALERRDNSILADNNVDLPILNVQPTGGPGAQVYGTNDTCDWTGSVNGSPALCYDILQ